MTFFAGLRLYAGTPKSAPLLGFGSSQIKNSLEIYVTKFKMKHYLIALSFLLLSCSPISFLTSVPAFAGGQEPEIIEVMAEDFVIGPLDISHLENGDTETVYTEVLLEDDEV